MLGGKAGILVQLLQKRLALQRKRENAAVFFGVEIPFHPVVDIEKMVGMHRAAAVGLEHIAFHRTQRIVVKLHKRVVGFAIVGKDAPRLELVIQFAPLAVIPSRATEARFVRAARAVNTGFGVGAVVAIERLEHRRPPRPRHVERGRPRKAFANGLVLVVHHIIVAEQPPCQGDRGRIRKRRDQVRQGARANVDIDKLVHIHR